LFEHRVQDIDDAINLLGRRVKIGGQCGEQSLEPARLGVQAPQVDPVPEVEVVLHRALIRLSQVYLGHQRQLVLMDCEGLAQL
jgi:hypothetical protein